MSSEQLAALLPCPFCGGDKLARCMTTAADLCFWSVECTSCGVEVADDESQEAADRHWNTRVTAPTRDGEVGQPIVPPENGEQDPEWRAIRRAIDQFTGRVPTISKHRAVHNTHLAAIVARLDEAGDREAADTIVWQCWYRALDRERERFLLDDAREQIARAALATQAEE